jgi:hypothetical protein
MQAKKKKYTSIILLQRKPALRGSMHMHLLLQHYYTVTVVTGRNLLYQQPNVSWLLSRRYCGCTVVTDGPGSLLLRHSSNVFTDVSRPVTIIIFLK